MRKIEKSMEMKRESEKKGLKIEIDEKDFLMKKE